MAYESYKPSQNRGYDESRASGSNRSETTDRSRRSRSSSKSSNSKGTRVRNPAGFELLGIGLAFGLSVGFVLGLGFNKMTGPGSVLSREGGSVLQPTEVIGAGVSPSVSAEELKRRQVQTQQRIEDWEKETFNIEDANIQHAEEEKQKAWKIIDGLDDSTGNQ